MLCSVRLACVGLLVGVSLIGSSALGGTIIKLDLGDDNAADVVFDGNQLSVVDDGNNTNTGNQDTEVEFLDFLSGETDINGPTPASFSMSGLTTSGAASVFSNVLVIQNFTGGTFSLFDDADNLLLSGLLDASTLAGPIGPPATGALFTTTFASVTGGSLATKIDSETITVSMGLSAINGGGGFGIGATNQLLPFTADATLAMSAEPIPEPATGLVALIAAALALVLTKRQR